MKLIIAGSRDFTWLSANDIVEYVSQIDFPFCDITEVVSGGAKGVDRAGEMFAEKVGLPIKRFPYKSELGKAGGPIRNQEMADYADVLVLIWDGKSKGSASMKREMLARNKDVFEFVVTFKSK